MLSTKYNTTAIDEFLVIFLIAAKAKGTSLLKFRRIKSKRESETRYCYKILKEIGIKLVKIKMILR